MKLAIIVRKDLGMRTGKIAGQVAHASVLAYAYSEDYYGRKEWLQSGQKKIVLKANSEAELHSIEAIARTHNLETHQVKDMGLTQIEPDTLTCISIGPDEDNKIDLVTKGMSLL